MRIWALGYSTRCIIAGKHALASVARLGSGRTNEALAATGSVQGKTLAIRRGYILHAITDSCPRASYHLCLS